MVTIKKVVGWPAISEVMSKLQMFAFFSNIFVKVSTCQSMEPPLLSFQAKNNATLLCLEIIEYELPAPSQTC